MLRIALSHDIDRVDKSYQYITKSLAHLVKMDIKGLSGQIKSIGKKKPYWTFDRFIEIEKSYNIRSSVFFLNESIGLKPLSIKSYKLSMGRYGISEPRIIEIIKYLDNNGWEIGVHGSYNSYKNFNLLLQEKQVLEIIVGHPIIGIRQHYLNLDSNTWKIQEKAGFKYDSSWGYTTGVGFLEDKFEPFYPLQNSFKVIPLVLMDTCFMSLPEKWFVYENLLDSCESNNAVMVINFHQHVFNEYDFPGYTEAYIEIIERAKRRNATFHTLSEI